RTFERQSCCYRTMRAPIRKRNAAVPPTVIVARNPSVDRRRRLMVCVVGPLLLMTALLVSCGGGPQATATERPADASSPQPPRAISPEAATRKAQQFCDSLHGEYAPAVSNSTFVQPAFCRVFLPGSSDHYPWEVTFNSAGEVFVWACADNVVVAQWNAN